VARAVYSTVFYRGFPGPGIIGLYTAPAGYTTVVRDIQVRAPGILADSFNGWCSIYDSASQGEVASWTFPYVSPWQHLSWDGRAVMNAGDLLLCNSQSTGWLLYVSGYLLTLP
jgi:hypothetical protein